MAKLIVHLPEGKKIDHEFTDEVTTIGRASDNKLAIAEASVSGHHARVTTTGGQYIFEDLNSTNGSFLNGSRITSAPLEDGDIVMVGLVECTYLAEPAVKAEPLPKPPRPLPKTPKHPAPR